MSTMTTYGQRQALIAAQIEAVERFEIPAPRRIGYADPPFEGYDISEMRLKIPLALDALRRLLAIDEATWSDLAAWRAAYRAAISAVYGPYRLEWISPSRFIDTRPQECWYSTRTDLNRMYPLEIPDLQEAA